MESYFSDGCLLFLAHFSFLAAGLLAGYGIFVSSSCGCTGWSSFCLFSSSNSSMRHLGIVSSIFFLFRLNFRPYRFCLSAVAAFAFGYNALTTSFFSLRSYSSTLTRFVDFFNFGGIEAACCSIASAYLSYSSTEMGTRAFTFS